MKIKKENVNTLLDTRFIKVYDLQYEEGKHYFDATRRNLEEIVAIKSESEAQKMLPDAVSSFVILKVKNEEPRLLLFQEYRYPAGRFLLSVPAGLIDKEDIEQIKAGEGTEPDVLKADELEKLRELNREVILRTAKREIMEETGLTIKPTDKLEVVSPFAYSTPGMTDESNAIVCAVVELENEKELEVLNQNGAVGSERFDGFELVTEDTARKILKNGCDNKGDYYSIYTWAALTWFTTGLWK